MPQPDLAADLAKVRSLFNEAIERRGAEREAFLATACGEDSDLRARLDSLLAAAEQPDRFLAAPTSDHAGTSAGATLVGPPLEGPGAKIGPYKLLQLIGEGGFGSVFMAEQEKPVARKVALKIIKLGMDTRQVIARFEAERQALAMMDHPNIAKVLDAGATEAGPWGAGSFGGGRPYFVMELVKGDPVTDYCDRNNLSTHERLDLFIQVCHAVQHAHQKGIIHRDLKPSNVLVTIGDGKPIPKVIDFGIAKATSARLTEKTLFTEHRALIGTPEYMSPEQAEMSGVDIDTRSDIYSLGVLLYELLTGTTPFSSQDLRSAAFGEIQRIIREVEPPKPSTRLSTLGETLPGIAAHRRTEPARLSKMLRGDLDWIVMKCLEKDRTRRYETASSLAEDVRSHLAGETVNAAPPSRAYRMSKFVRRHKVGVAAGTAITTALLFGVFGTTLGFLNANAQQQRAEQALTAAETARAQEKVQRENAESARTAAEAARLLETQQREAAQAMSGFLVQTLKGVGPSVALGRDTTMLREMMDDAAARIEAGALRDNPEAEIRLRISVGVTYGEIGAIDEADKQLERAVALARQVLPDGHEGLASALGSMGWLRSDCQRRHAEAVPLFEQALAIYREMYGEPHPRVATAFNNLAFAQMGVENDVEAARLFRQSVEVSQRASGEDDAGLAIALHNLGALRRKQGDMVEADQYSQRALEMQRRLFRGDHPDLVETLKSRAETLDLMGRSAEADLLLRESLEMQRRLFPGARLDVANALNNFGSRLTNQGRLEEAEPLFRESLAIKRQVLASDHPDLAITLNNLATLLKRRGELDAADSLSAEALEIARRLFPSDNSEDSKSLAVFMSSRIGILDRLGRIDEAVTLGREALSMTRRLEPAGSTVLASALATLGRSLLDDSPTPQAAAEAESVLRECLTIRQKELPDGHAGVWRRFSAMSLLGGALLGVAQDATLASSVRIEKLREAEPLVLDGYAGLKDDPNVPAATKTADYADYRREALERIVRLYETWEGVEPGKGYQEKAKEWRLRSDAPP